MHKLWAIRVGSVGGSGATIPDTMTPPTVFQEKVSLLSFDSLLPPQMPNHGFAFLASRGLESGCHWLGTPGAGRLVSGSDSVDYP